MNTNRTKTIRIRLNEKEFDIFKKKAERYQCLSVMIRDAVAQFDDLGTKRKLEALREMIAFYQKYQQELSWMGGNFNQMMKRANELTICGELSTDYFTSLLSPEVAKIMKLLKEMKDEQYEIVKKIIR